MRTATRLDHGFLFEPVSSQVLLNTGLRVLIGTVLLAAMVLAGIALGYASSLDLQL